jgi:hypothetical protein
LRAAGITINKNKVILDTAVTKNMYGEQTKLLEEHDFIDRLLAMVQRLS